MLDVFLSARQLRSTIETISFFDFLTQTPKQEEKIQNSVVAKNFKSKCPGLVDIFSPRSDNRQLFHWAILCPKK